MAGRRRGLGHPALAGFRVPSLVLHRIDRPLPQTSVPTRPAIPDGNVQSLFVDGHCRLLGRNEPRSSLDTLLDTQNRPVPDRPVLRVDPATAPSPTVVPRPPPKPGGQLDPVASSRPDLKDLLPKCLADGKWKTIADIHKWIASRYPRNERIVPCRDYAMRNILERNANFVRGRRKGRRAWRFVGHPVVAGVVGQERQSGTSRLCSGVTIPPDSRPTPKLIPGPSNLLRQSLADGEWKSFSEIRDWITTRYPRPGRSPQSLNYSLLNHLYRSPCFVRRKEDENITWRLANVTTHVATVSPASCTSQAAAGWPERRDAADLPFAFLDPDTAFLMACDSDEDAGEEPEDPSPDVKIDLDALTVSVVSVTVEPLPSLLLNSSHQSSEPVLNLRRNAESYSTNSVTTEPLFWQGDTLMTTFKCEPIDGATLNETSASEPSTSIAAETRNIETSVGVCPVIATSEFKLSTGTKSTSSGVDESQSYVGSRESIPRRGRLRKRFSVCYAESPLSNEAETLAFPADDDDQPSFSAPASPHSDQPQETNKRRDGARPPLFTPDCVTRSRNFYRTNAEHPPQSIRSLVRLCFAEWRKETISLSELRQWLCAHFRRYRLLVHWDAVYSVLYSCLCFVPTFVTWRFRNRVDWSIDGRGMCELCRADADDSSSGRDPISPVTGSVGLQWKREIYRTTAREPPIHPKLLVRQCFLESSSSELTSNVVHQWLRTNFLFYHEAKKKVLTNAFKTASTYPYFQKARQGRDCFLRFDVDLYNRNPDAKAMKDPFKVIWYPLTSTGVQKSDHRGSKDASSFGEEIPSSPQKVAVCKRSSKRIAKRPRINFLEIQPSDLAPSETFETFDDNAVPDVSGVDVLGDSFGQRDSSKMADFQRSNFQEIQPGGSAPPEMFESEKAVPNILKDVPNIPDNNQEMLPTVDSPFTLQSLLNLTIENIMASSSSTTTAVQPFVFGRRVLAESEGDGFQMSPVRPHDNTGRDERSVSEGDIHSDVDSPIISEKTLAMLPTVDLSCILRSLLELPVKKATATSTSTPLRKKVLSNSNLDRIQAAAVRSNCNTGQSCRSVPECVLLSDDSTECSPNISDPNRTELQTVDQPLLLRSLLNSPVENQAAISTSTLCDPPDVFRNSVIVNYNPARILSNVEPTLHCTGRHFSPVPEYCEPSRDSQNVIYNQPASLRMVDNPCTLRSLLSTPVKNTRATSTGVSCFLPEVFGSSVVENSGCVRIRCVANAKQPLGDILKSYPPDSGSDVLSGRSSAKSQTILGSETVGSPNTLRSLLNSPVECAAVTSTGNTQLLERITLAQSACKRVQSNIVRPHYGTGKYHLKVPYGGCSKRLATNLPNLPDSNPTPPQTVDISSNSETPTCLRALLEAGKVQHGKSGATEIAPHNFECLNSIRNSYRPADAGIDRVHYRSATSHPPLSVRTLVRLCFTETEMRKMRLYDLQHWLKTNFAHYRHLVPRQWDAVHSVLYTCRCFAATFVGQHVWWSMVSQNKSTCELCRTAANEDVARAAAPVSSEPYSPLPLPSVSGGVTWDRQRYLTTAEQPPFPANVLYRQCFLESPKKMLGYRDIKEWLVTHFLYFRNMDEKEFSGFIAAGRLHLLPYFHRIQPTSGRKVYYTLDDEHYNWRPNHYNQHRRKALQRPDPLFNPIVENFVKKNYVWYKVNRMKKVTDIRPADADDGGDGELDHGGPTTTPASVADGDTGNRETTDEQNPPSLEVEEEGGDDSDASSSSAAAEDDDDILVPSAALWKMPVTSMTPAEMLAHLDDARIRRVYAVNAERPVFPVWIMLCRCILDSPGRRADLPKMYRWLAANFKYYRTFKNSGWGVVRYEVNRLPCFVRDSASKQTTYSVHEEALGDMTIRPDKAMSLQRLLNWLNREEGDVERGKERVPSEVNGSEGGSDDEGAETTGLGRADVGNDRGEIAAVVGTSENAGPEERGGEKEDQVKERATVITPSDLGVLNVKNDCKECEDGERMMCGASASDRSLHPAPGEGSNVGWLLQEIESREEQLRAEKEPDAPPSGKSAAPTRIDSFPQDRHLATDPRDYYPELRDAIYRTSPERPPFPLRAVVRQCLVESPADGLMFAEIRGWIRRRYLFFDSAPAELWMSVQSLLSSGCGFVKRPVDGTRFVRWTLDDSIYFRREKRSGGGRVLRGGIKKKSGGKLSTVGVDVDAATDTLNVGENGSLPPSLEEDSVAGELRPPPVNGEAVDVVLTEPRLLPAADEAMPKTRQRLVDKTASSRKRRNAKQSSVSQRAKSDRRCTDGRSDSLELTATTEEAGESGETVAAPARRSARALRSARKQAVYREIDSEEEISGVDGGADSLIATDEEFSGSEWSAAESGRDCSERSGDESSGRGRVSSNAVDVGSRPSAGNGDAVDEGRIAREDVGLCAAGNPPTVVVDDATSAGVVVPLKRKRHRRKDVNDPHSVQAEFKKELKKNGKLYRETNVMPSFTHKVIYVNAFKSSPNYQLTMNQLCEWLRNHFRHFREMNDGKLKSAIKAALQTNGCFRKTSGVKGGPWTVDDAKLYGSRMCNSYRRENAVLHPRIRRRLRQLADARRPLPVGDDEVAEVRRLLEQTERYRHLESGEPPVHFRELLRACLVSHRKEQLGVDSIVAWFRERFAYYRGRPEAEMRMCVRQHLLERLCFVSSGDGTEECPTLWTYDPKSYLKFGKMGRGK